MNRRKFISSLAAFGLAPLLPAGKLAHAIASPVSGITANAASATANSSTYKWAEVLVRSHKHCSASFLQRHLQIGATQAANIEMQLIRNGVITASRNAYGFRQATKPLWDEILPRLQSNLQKTVRKVAGQARDNIEQSFENNEENDEEVSVFRETTNDEIQGKANCTHPSPEQA